MTKQRHCATSPRPSRLCRLLLLALGLKLVLLGMLLADPLPDGSPHPLSRFSGFLTGEAARAATQPDAKGQAAPPASDLTVPSATLPDSGMLRQGPGEVSPQAPGAAPRVLPGKEEAVRPKTLPPIAPGQGDPQREEAAGRITPPGETNEALIRRQQELTRREQELRALENDLNNRLEQMKLLENRLSTMIKDAGETSDAKLRHLVDVLANMKAKQAAAVLETLDQKIAVRVLAGMRGRQAGEILSYVKPEIAAQLTESLARMQLPME